MSTGISLLLLSVLMAIAYAKIAIGNRQSGPKQATIIALASRMPSTGVCSVWVEYSLE